MLCSEQANSGTISIPHLKWSESFTIDSNSCTSIVVPNLYFHLHYNRFTIEKNGIYLKTEKPVTVFSSEESNLGDHTLILPVYATGSDYIISTYDIGTTINDNNIDNAFILVSGYDNNQIEISPRVRYLNSKDSLLASFSITLNKGETYLYSDPGDLTGTRVKCLDPSKPISIFAGNYNTLIDSNCTDPKEGNDPVWEQIYPMESMDNEFVFVPFKYLNNGNIARIIALENNCNISINNRIVKTLNERQYFDTLLFTPTTIKSNKKISVIQFSRNKDCNYPKVNRDFVGDPSMLCLLPAKAMFTGNITFKTIALGFDNIKRHCLNIITHSRNINKIYLDTLNIRNFLNPLPGNSNYYYAQIDIEEGVHNISSSAMYLAYLYGFSGYGEKYEWDGGYSLSIGYGANLTSFRTEPETPICAQTLIEFTATAPEEVKYFEWVFEDTIKIIGKKVYYEFPKSGIYTVSLFSKLDSSDSEFWDIVQEEINVIPFIKPEIKTNPLNKKIICRGDNVVLSLTNNYYTYRWSTGETSSSIAVRRGGIYTVIVTSNNGCVGKASIEIEEYKTEKPTIELIGENPFCEGDSVILKINQQYHYYKWSNGDTSSTIVIKKPVSIYVTVIDSNGCSVSSDIIEIKGYSSPKPKIDGPDAVYSNFTASYKIEKVNNTIVQWSCSNGTIIGRNDLEQVEIQWVNFGIGEVEVLQSDTLTNCKGYDKLIVNIDSSLKPKITPSNKVICEGSFITLSATAGFDSYKWNTGDTTREIKISVPGKYFVSVTNKQGIRGNSDTFDIIAAKSPIPMITGQNRICNGETAQLICYQNFSKYLWSNGDTTQSIIVDEPGVYELTVIDSNNCIGKSSFTVDLKSSGLVGHNDYNFGNVILKNSKTNIFDLFNSSSENIKIQKIELKNLSNNAFKILNNLNFPIILASKEKLPLEIEFFPIAEKIYYDSLIIYITEPCSEILSMELSGVGIDKIPVVFILPDTIANAGEENYEIPIYAYLEIDTVINKNILLTYQVIFNSHYFQPEKVKFGRISENILDNKLIKLTVESDINSLSNQKRQINSIIGSVLVGYPEKGTLEFGEITFSDSTFFPVIINGKIKIEGVCQHSLNDFELSVGTSINLNSTIIDSELELQISSNESGFFLIRLFDTKGQEIMKFHWLSNPLNLNIEEKILNFNMSNYPSGVYLLVLQTPQKNLTKSILLIK